LKDERISEVKIDAKQKSELTAETKG